MVTLYELTIKYQHLVDIEDEVDPQTFSDTLDSIYDDITTKAENYARVDHQMSADIKQMKEEKERLTKKSALSKIISNIYEKN